MLFFDKLIKFLTLDYSIYPEINLVDSDIVKSQFENVKKFKLVRNRLYFLVVIFCLGGFLFSVFIDFFNLSRKTGLHIVFFMIFAIFSMTLMMFYMWKFKCPNCGAVPQGKSLSLSGGVTYTKGINPFPSRCTCCGFYLREGALIRDIKIQGDL